MLRDRNISFFIDVDNVGLKSDNYVNVMEQLNGMGVILSGKIYGAGERKHKEIYADAELHGYRIERPMRVKRRGKKEFDPRIYVDVVDAVARTPAIDAVCVIAQPADMVYLYSYLRSRGIKVIALDNADDASCAFIDEVIDLGIVLELKLPKQTAPAKRPEPARPATPAEQQPAPADGLDRTDELLREIERLRSSAAEETPRSDAPAAAQEAERHAETTSDEQIAETDDKQSTEADGEQTASIVDEAKSLLERIAEMRDSASHETSEQSEETPSEQAEEQTEEQTEQQSAPAAQEQTQAKEVAQPQDAPATETAAQPAQRTSVSNDSDLIRRIEEIRRNSQGGDEDFIAEIKKLLDGLE